MFEDGKMVSADFFDPDDRVAIVVGMSSWAGLGKLGDSASEQWFADSAALRGRDLDGIPARLAEEWAQVDHRAIGLHDYDKEQLAIEARGTWDAAADIRIEVDEVLAADERVFAGICTYRGTANADAGGGRFEVSVGFLADSDGELCTRAEWFEADDRDAILARYGELSAAGEPESEVLRLAREVITRWNAHDVERCVELYAEDGEQLDHRSLGGEPVRGHPALREAHRTAFEVFPDSRVRLDEVLAHGEQVIAYLVTFRATSPDAAGGEGELAQGGVGLFEDGKVVRLEAFDADDMAGIIGRYVELGGSVLQLGDRPPERHFEEWARRFLARDLESLRELYAPDCWLVDHRPFSYFGELRGVENVLEMARSTLTSNLGARWGIDEVLACDDQVIAARCTWYGKGIKAGDFAVSWGFVSVIKDGQNLGLDVYDADDRDAMLARFAELSGASEVSLGGTSAEHLVAEYLRLIEARDLDAIGEVLSDEIEVADHRPVAAPPGRGRDAALELMRSALDVTSELRFEVEERIASDERAVALRGTWAGTAADGHGEVVLPMALVVAVDGERVVSLDLYEPEDTDAIRTRFAELSGEGSPA